MILAVLFVFLESYLFLLEHSVCYAETVQDNQTKVLLVPQQFPAIQSAVDAAVNGDTILISPGDYCESVDMQYKNICLSGSGGSQTKIIWDGSDYMHPVIDHIAAGTIQFLTIYSHSMNDEDGTKPRFAPAYCVHIDNDYSQNQTIYFNDVSFHSDSGTAVGNGLRPHCKVFLKNCILRTEGDAAPALFVHNWSVVNPPADMKGQQLILDNCFLENASYQMATIVVQNECYGEHLADIIFQNRNIIQNKGHDKWIDGIRTEEKYSAGIMNFIFDAKELSRLQKTPEISDFQILNKGVLE